MKRQSQKHLTADKADPADGKVKVKGKILTTKGTKHTKAGRTLYLFNLLYLWLKRFLVFEK